MKKIALILFAALALCSCSDDNDEDVPVYYADFLESSPSMMRPGIDESIQKHRHAIIKQLSEALEHTMKEKDSLYHVGDAEIQRREEYLLTLSAPATLSVSITEKGKRLYELYDCYVYTFTPASSIESEWGKIDVKADGIYVNGDKVSTLSNYSVAILLAGNEDGISKSWDSAYNYNGTFSTEETGNTITLRSEEWEYQLSTKDNMLTQIKPEYRNIGVLEKR